MTNTLHSDARRARLFAGLTDAEADDILSLAQPRHARAGETLFRQGESPERLLFVVRGLVRMTQAGADDEQTTLRLMGGGELVGCVAVVRRFPYPATATALQESALLSWSASDFLNLLKRHMTLTHNLLDIVGDRTREMVERVGDLSGKNLEARLAIALLRLARQAGSSVDGHIQIKVSTARADLSALAGAGYFTISRVLSGWRKLGIIQSGRQRIVIIDEAQLARIAEGRLTITEGSAQR